MRKGIVFLSIVVGVVGLAMIESSVAWAKAHVPLGRAQICTAQGKVKNIASRTLGKRISQGGCRLTACAFDDVDDGDLIKQFIFFPGGDCDPTDANGDGFCDAPGSPADVPGNLSAVNVTPACTDPF